ncbi:TPA: hypothetical protein DEG21_02145 [Patescibacteria group bacterium]|nr:hypothetical protein [Candidatus Gracilibacteria bacterium]
MSSAFCNNASASSLGIISRNHCLESESRTSQDTSTSLPDKIHLKISCFDSRETLNLRSICFFFSFFFGFCDKEPSTMSVTLHFTSFCISLEGDGIAILPDTLSSANLSIGGI